MLRSSCPLPSLPTLSSLSWWSPRPTRSPRRKTRGGPCRVKDGKEGVLDWGGVRKSHYGWVSRDQGPYHGVRWGDKVAGIPGQGSRAPTTTSCLIALFPALLPSSRQQQRGSSQAAQVCTEFTENPELEQFFTTLWASFLVGQRPGKGVGHSRERQPQRPMRGRHPH